MFILLTTDLLSSQLELVRLQIIHVTPIFQINTWHDNYFSCILPYLDIRTPYNNPSARPDRHYRENDPRPLMLVNGGIRPVAIAGVAISLRHSALALRQINIVVIVNYRQSSNKPSPDFYCITTFAKLDSFPRFMFWTSGNRSLTARNVVVVVVVVVVIVVVVVLVGRWGSCCYQIFKALKLFLFSNDRN